MGDAAGGFPHRVFPCSECPWRVDTPPGQFTAARFRRLAVTAGSDDDPVMPGMPMFGCHKGEPGTDADLACAGWLAVCGEHHLMVRLAILEGLLPPGAVSPAPGWPALFPTYEAMAKTQGRRR